MIDADLRLNGVYTNIKTGNPYRVIGEADHTEREERLVLYTRSDIGGKIYARPYELFLQKFEPRK